MVLSKPPSVSLTLKRPPLSLPVPLSKKAKEDCEQKQKKIHVLEEDEENLFSSAHNNGNLSLLLYYFTLFYLYYFIKVI
jgi:hypothetical protein